MMIPARDQFCAAGASRTDADDPGQEPGRAQRQQAQDQEVPEAAEHAASVVNHGGQRGQDVERGEQQPGHVDHGVERALHARGEQVDPGQGDQQEADRTPAGTGVRNRGDTEASSRGRV